MKNDEEIAGTKYDFIYGSRTIPRIAVNDLSVNSRGFSIMITLKEAVPFGMECMLVNEDEVPHIKKTVFYSILSRKQHLNPKDYHIHQLHHGEVLLFSLR